MPKISIIIPVYNTEKYLSRCLDSVVNQTLEDIEIICINDCSTDGSLAILQKYAKKDKRIRIINLPKNSGAGSARNIGIDNSNSEYIGFVDSDDFIDLDFYEKLYRNANKTDADAVKGNIYNYVEETKSSKLTDFYNMNDKIRENFAYFYYGFTSAIYKKSFLDMFKIRFPEGINYFEDPYFSIKACVNYKKLTFEDGAKYYYERRNNSSSSNHLTISNFKNFSFVAFNIIEFLNNDNIPEKEYKIILNFLFNFVTGNLHNKTIENDLKEYIIDIIIEMLFVVKYQFSIPKVIIYEIDKRIANKSYNEKLLKYYKKYDYLNQNKTLVKLLVSYIKPSFLFKSEILTPMHLGRSVEKDSSKDGIITDKDIKWLHENCIGDNDFKGNISYLNRRLGFFTGTYWAWKNYEKLGNPEYFGSLGYRRLFLPNCLNDIDKYDLILPEKKVFKETIKSQMTAYHGDIFYEVALDVIKNIYPGELKNVENYFNNKEGYFAEIYIMKKELFFDFCEWLVKIIEYLFAKYKNSLYADGQGVSRTRKLIYDFLYDKNEKLDFSIQNGDVRDFAFIIERLTGYYLHKLTQNKTIKYKECFVPEPINKFFEDNKPMILEKMRQNIKKDMVKKCQKCQ